MRVILVDDEQYSLRVLENLLSKEKDLEIVGSYTNPEEALKDLDNTEPDGALLDIEMPGMNGLELGAQLMNKRSEMEIIFITAYSEYALEAFEVSAIDYLLKPVSEKRLAGAIARLRNRIEASKTSSRLMSSDGLRIKSFGGFDLYDSNGRTVNWRTKKGKELFIYLWLLEGRSVNKDQIIEDVFPEKTADKGSALLHTTIYQIRNGLKKVGVGDSISYVNENYYLNISVESDIKLLKDLLEKDELTAEDIESIVGICRGEFLQESYPWMADVKQEIDNMVFNRLNKCGRRQHQLLTAEALKLMLKIDPYSEEAARWMIELLGKQGKKKEMVLFYNGFVSELSRELGISPSRETENLLLQYY